ncbi:MAG: sugar transporter permease, partial [Devosia sp.]|nr:sugar transporter permease [Devosia sp.]
MTTDVQTLSQPRTKDRVSFFASPRAIPYMLLLPAIVVILSVVLVPLLVSFWTSFTAYNLTKPATLFQFVGLRNYQRLLTNADFWWAFGRTFVFVTITLNLEMLLGLGLAL